VTTTMICSGCFEEKPRSDFKHGNRCSRCRSLAWTNWKAEKADQEKHAAAVQLNRLLNSIPVPRVRA
jgi:hypothetical protein